MIPEAQLYNYKARVYDPGLGRFLQTDPAGYASDVNLYAYAVNDPVNGSDPSGLLTCVGDSGGEVFGDNITCFNDLPPIIFFISLGGGDLGGDPGIKLPTIPPPSRPTRPQSKQVKNPKCGKAIMQPKYTGIFGEMGRDLSINPLFPTSTALQESGWDLVHVYGTNSSSHGQPLNNLFGQTYGGGNNIPYPSVQASAQAWEDNWGPYLQNRPQSIQQYAADLNSNPNHRYNSNPAYPGELAARYNQLLITTQACGTQF